jgi:hypothetical protein
VHGFPSLETGFTAADIGNITRNIPRKFIFIATFDELKRY